MTNTEPPKDTSGPSPIFPWLTNAQVSQLFGGALTSGNPVGGVLDALNPLGSNGVFGVFQRPDFWIRAGIFAAGVGLVIVGIVILVSSSRVVGDVLTAAGKTAKVTPAGAAATVLSESVSA